MIWLCTDVLHDTYNIEFHLGLPLEVISCYHMSLYLMSPLCSVHVIQYIYVNACGIRYACIRDDQTLVVVCCLSIYIDG